ncbi:MAG: hypothetical protein HZB76_00340 [Chlamydiae bacterium]|nr:hypothetical protein [Chlamydiota bacterium]
MTKSFFLLALFLLTSCGYRFEEKTQADRPTISVGYVSGDQTGILTQLLIKELASSGYFQYANHDAELKLNVKILDKSNSVIGYRHDRHNDGSYKKTVMPTEGREKVVVEVSIISSASGSIVLGPYEINTDSDYDFVEKDTLDDLSFVDPLGNRIKVLPFSMGQMESIESAQTAALTPLYRQVAQKVIDLISAEW